MLDLNQNITTRDGRRVRILTTNSQSKFQGTSFPIVAEVSCADGSADIVTYTRDGHHRVDGLDSSADLVNSLDLTQPVQTRAGHKARILATDSQTVCDGVKQPVVAEVMFPCHGALLWTFSRDGRYLPSRSESPQDLVNVNLISSSPAAAQQESVPQPPVAVPQPPVAVPPQVVAMDVGWCNVYPTQSGDGYYLGSAKRNKFRADRAARTSVVGRVACIPIKVQFTIGEGLTA